MGNTNSSSKADSRIKYPKYLKAALHNASKGNIPSIITMASYCLSLSITETKVEDKESYLSESIAWLDKITKTDYVIKDILLSEIAVLKNDAKTAEDLYLKSRTQNQTYFSDWERFDFFYVCDHKLLSDSLGPPGKLYEKELKSFFSGMLGHLVRLKDTSTKEEHEQYITDSNKYALGQLPEYYCGFINRNALDYTNVLEKIALIGDVKAQAYLGMIYLDHFGKAAKNEEKGIYWLNMATKQNYWLAWLMLGEEYARVGSTHSLDQKRAFECLLIGAKLTENLLDIDLSAAMMQGIVGNYYRKGLGVLPDTLQALNWLTLSAKTIDQIELHAGETITRNVRGLQEVTHVQVWYNLAMIYRDGEGGTPKNPIQAIYYFQKLASYYLGKRNQQQASFYQNEADKLRLEMQNPNNQTTISQDVTLPQFSGSTFIIDYNALIIKQKLGAGAFGDVFYAESGQEKYAVKQLRMQTIDDKTLQDFKNETEIMSKLHSDYIISLRGICIKPYCIVMEYAQNGTLYGYLHKDMEIKWSKRIEIAIGIGKGLAFLHAQNPKILHRDLKSANVLLDKNYDAKLTDFGLAKLKSESTSKVTMGAAGTPAWMAPELFEKNPYHTTAADIYSYAIVLWELATREEPYSGLSAMQIMGQLFRDERPDFPENTCSIAYRTTVMNAWKKEPGQRSSVSTIINELNMQLENKNDAVSVLMNQSIGNLGAPSTQTMQESIGFLGAASQKYTPGNKK